MVLIANHKAQFFLYQTGFFLQMKLFPVRNQAEFCNKELSSESTCQELKYM